MARNHPSASNSKNVAYGLWLALIVAFAVLHALHLRADFPNHSPWYMDWAKYTDEGWYGNAAVRAHLFGNWYLPGDFNPAPAVPVWPFLEWLLFFATGVTVEAARGLAVAFFFANVVLSYTLLRERCPAWVGLLAVTLLVTSPFLYCFSRLAVLEPMLTTLTLGALNIATRLPRCRRPLLASAWIGILFTLMMLTKTTAVFLLPALGWATLLPLRQNRRTAICCAAAAGSAFILSFGFWMGLVIANGLLADYKYLFFINKYIKPAQFYWPVLSFWWSFHGGLWIDHILVPLAGLVFLGVVAAALVFARPVGRMLLLDPVFGSSILAAVGYILFMTYQNHPQPRYFALVAFFCFFVVAQGAGALLAGAAQSNESSEAFPPGIGSSGVRRRAARFLGWAVVGLATVSAGYNGAWTLNYAFHPEYTFVDAARRLTGYIDTHPNGKRLLLSISGDEIAMVTHMPAICDDFGTQDLVTRLGIYQPGWWATWNDIDPGTLEDLHTRYSLEQVAVFRAFDDPERDRLVLFKLHPLANGELRDPSEQNLQLPLSGDRILIPVQ